MPVLERVDGRSALEDGLRQLAVVEADIAQDGLLQVFAAVEAMALQDIEARRSGCKGRDNQDENEAPVSDRREGVARPEVWHRRRCV